MFLWIAILLLAANNAYCLLTALNDFKKDRMLRAGLGLGAALSIDAALVFWIASIVNDPGFRI